MSRSVASRASNASSKMLQDLANRSQSKIYRVEGSMNDEEMRVIWNALGLYISRNLKMGRGVNVPRLGIFTFTPPEVRLKGVTNEEQRDNQPRNPVFLIQKEFLKGVNLRTAIFYHQEFGSGLRPYAALGATGEVPVTKMNLIEVSSYANMPKDATELGINRIIKYIADKLLSGSNISLQLPNLGQLMCRNHLVGVRFNEYVMRDTRNVLARSVDQRKLRGNMSLTTDNLKRLNNETNMSYRLGSKTQQFFDIDEKAKQFLSTTFNIEMDNNNNKRSMTNFDRTFASRIFDKTNQSLRESHNFRMTQSGTFGQTHSYSGKEFNMALKILKEWIRDNGFNAQNSFIQFCRLANKKSNVLNHNDFWHASKQVSIDITEQQSLELFRIMDQNKDGLVTWEDWIKNIHFDENNQKMKELVKFIKNKRYGISKVLGLLGFEGVRRVSVFSLKEGLIKIWPGCSQEDALLLSKYIAKGKEEIEVERIIDALNVKEDQQVEVDKEWEAKFMGRIKRKMGENNVTEEQLLSKFKIYDSTNCGFIEQTDFKTVLGELGVSLNLTQLIKIVKLVPINGKNQLRYDYVVGHLMETEAAGREQLSEGEFRSVMKKVLASNNAFSVPINVTKLTSWLQSKHLKQYDESQVLKCVRQIDLNEDETVDADDLRRYKELISDKVFKPMSNLEVEDLLIKLREKRIRKKISVYDLFRKLDKVGSGFLTRQAWFKNINEIIQFSDDEKDSMFNYMDKAKTKVVDYKTFLGVINGDPNGVVSQKFDWVETTLDKIKTWFSGSSLTAEDGFKLLDKDNDGYLSEKDLHDFLIEKLKYQERELGMVRIQKMMKVMDAYKNGRITFIDWLHLINRNSNWLADARQQIGIILSKNYGSLNEAFYEISTGDKKLLFSSFQKWIKSCYVLSGFMINEEMLKFIFNSLDQHKKGYILENDFIGLFKGYSWKSEHSKEVTDFLKVKFGSSQDAYKYFLGYSKGQLDFNRFKEVLEEFFRGRFQPSEVKNIWKNIGGGHDSIDQAQFNKLNGHLWSTNDNSIDKQFPKDGWQYQDFSIIKGTTVRSGEFNYMEKQKMEDQCNKFINNLKDILASSPRTLEQVFSEVDKEKNGRITNLAFKKAFRTLNIALTSKQIDLLLNYCEFKSETLIDWKKFVKMLDLHEDKLKIRSRMQPKLQHISDLLHYYMISPKDAFRKWNNPRTGYVNYEEFHKILKELFTQASQRLPEFHQLEDLFKFIDVRKDSNIDFQEWTEMFRTCNPPNLLMGTTPASSDQIISKPKIDKEANMPIKERSIPKFRNSQIYEQFVHLIGRNRRYLQEEIEKSNTEKMAFIPFSNVDKVVRQFAGKHGCDVDSGMVRNLIAFSMTGEKVDYHLLVAKFKDMNVEVKQFPKVKVF